MPDRRSRGARHRVVAAGGLQAWIR